MKTDGIIAALPAKRVISLIGGYLDKIIQQNIQKKTELYLGLE